VFDERLVSRFDRIGGTSPDEPITPPIYIAFDVLWLNGRDLRPKPLRERRRILERVVDAHSPFVLPVRRLPAPGGEAWAEGFR
jgi:ATP-dependent DNA ligase